MSYHNRDSAMGAADRIVEIESLERGLLSDSFSSQDSTVEDELVLYSASFEEMEDNYVKYQTAQWILHSLLLILAWGIGLFMLLYLPVRRYILRKDFQSRKLYITPNAIIYKVTRPIPFPCFGVLKKEKHILLPSVADVVIEQGYLQSFFGIHSIRIENAGVRKPPSDDVQIQGISNPTEFRKKVLLQLSNWRNESYVRHHYTNEESSYSGSSYPHLAMMSPSKSLRNDLLSRESILQKLEDVESSVKRVQILIEKRQCQSS